LAGPASNVILAMLLAVVTRFAAGPAPALADYAFRGVYLSLYLALFNLLPVPPLDGSKLLLALRIPVVIYREVAQFGFLFLVVAMVASDLGRWMSLLSLQGTRFLLSLIW
jgi:Zn-dependent protease